MTDKLSILIVDDNRTNLALMDMLVRKLPNCATRLETDLMALLEGLDGVDYDLAVFTCRPPQAQGIEAVRRVKSHPRLRDRPILIAADEPDPGFRARAREAGVDDVLAKPIDPVVFRARILALARRAALPPPPEASWEEAPALSSDIPAREEAFLSVLVKVASWRDQEPKRHAQRMGRYCAIIAHHLGLPADYCRDIRIAAPLHDVGRAGLRDGLRGKAGFLSPEERKEMEEHTRLGHAMLSLGASPVFRMGAEIALTHHERWDGSGYPNRLKGEQIPLAGRIAAVADVFDALTSIRSQRSQWALGNAFNYLAENAGVEFDPSCVAAFENGREEVGEVMRAMAGDEGEDEADSAADAA